MFLLIKNYTSFIPTNTAVESQNRLYPIVLKSHTCTLLKFGTLSQLPLQIPCVIFLLCVVLVVRYKWRRDADPRAQPPQPPPACTSCQLVEMGEMVLLGDKCNKCGRSRAEVNLP